MHSEVRWRSLGPVAAIVPWNFPLQLASAKFAPALAAGNTVVLKPSPFTPLATRLLGDVLSAALPEGVLTVVTGREPLGACLASHPGIRHVTFTGSVTAGRAVAAGAASGLARVTLELGGNDAAVLLDDVDVERIADRLFWAAFRNCGQVCMAVKRVYAPARLHSRVVEALAERAKSVVVGATTGPRSWGPSTTPPNWPGWSGTRPRPWRTGRGPRLHGHRLDRPATSTPRPS